MAKIVVVIIVVTVLLILAWIVLTYNSLVTKQIAAQAQWQQVENQLQRKRDLIPTLLNLTFFYMQFEQNLITNLTDRQTQWQNATGILDQVNLSNALSATIALWLATAVNYPDLTSSAAYLTLTDNITGTESRIAVERGRYNDRVREYNTAISTFPGNMFGFQPEPFFDLPGGP